MGYPDRGEEARQQITYVVRPDALSDGELFVTDDPVETHRVVGSGCGTAGALCRDRSGPGLGQARNAVRVLVVDLLMIVS